MKDFDWMFDENATPEIKEAQNAEETIDESQEEIVAEDEVIDEGTTEEDTEPQAEDAEEEQPAENVDEEEEDTEPEAEATEMPVEIPFEYEDSFHLKTAVKRKITDVDGNEFEVELTDDDLGNLALDKHDGLRDLMIDTLDKAAPVIKAYSQVGIVKWFVDNLNQGYTEQQLLEHLTAQITKPAEQPIEEEYLTDEQREIRELKKQQAEVLARLKEKEAKEQQQIQQQQYKAKQQATLQSNETHLNKAFEELGIDKNSLSEADKEAVITSFKQFYPKDEKDPNKGFISFVERNYTYNQIKGVLNHALVLNKKKTEDKKAKVNTQIKNAKAPKIAGGNVGASASKSTKPIARTSGESSESQRLAKVNKLFSYIGT